MDEDSGSPAGLQAPIHKDLLWCCLCKLELPQASLCKSAVKKLCSLDFPSRLPQNLRESLPADELWRVCCQVCMKNKKLANSSRNWKPASAAAQHRNWEAQREQELPPHPSAAAAAGQMQFQMQMQRRIQMQMQMQMQIQHQQQAVSENVNREQTAAAWRSKVIAELTRDSEAALKSLRYECMYLCMYVCMYVCRYVCMSVFMYVYLYVSVHTHIHTNTHTHTHTHTHSHTHTYVHRMYMYHTRIHTHTHTHTHTHMFIAELTRGIKSAF